MSALSVFVPVNGATVCPARLLQPAKLTHKVVGPSWVGKYNDMPVMSVTTGLMRSGSRSTARRVAGRWATRAEGAAETRRRIVRNIGRLLGEGHRSVAPGGGFGPVIGSGLTPLIAGRRRERTSPGTFFWQTLRALGPAPFARPGKTGRICGPSCYTRRCRGRKGRVTSRSLVDRRAKIPYGLARPLRETHARAPHRLPARSSDRRPRGRPGPIPAGRDRRRPDHPGPPARRLRTGQEGRGRPAEGTTRGEQAGRRRRPGHRARPDARLRRGHRRVDVQQGDRRPAVRPVRG